MKELLSTVGSHAFYIPVTLLATLMNMGRSTDLSTLKDVKEYSSLSFLRMLAAAGPAAVYISLLHIPRCRLELSLRYTLSKASAATSSPN